MSKLEDMLRGHPEMTPIAVTRLEIAKVSEPTLRAGLEAVVDLIDLAIGNDAPTSAPRVGGEHAEISDVSGWLNPTGPDAKKPSWEVTGSSSTAVLLPAPATKP
jgi:hypothetical protein